MNYFIFFKSKKNRKLSSQPSKQVIVNILNYSKAFTLKKATAKESAVFIN